MRSLLLCTCVLLVGLFVGSLADSFMEGFSVGASVGSIQDETLEEICERQAESTRRLVMDSLDYPALPEVTIKYGIPYDELTEKGFLLGSRSIAENELAAYTAKDVIYVNPRVLKYTAVRRGIELEVLVREIMTHEFIHVYQYHQLGCDTAQDLLEAGKPALRGIVDPEHLEPCLSAMVEAEAYHLEDILTGIPSEFDGNSEMQQHISKLVLASKWMSVDNFYTGGIVDGTLVDHLVELEHYLKQIESDGYVSQSYVAE
jgi:hypothetical protein